MDHLPLIDLRAPPDEIARGIGEACRAHGFFYVVGHGIDESLGQRLEALSHRFFALPDATKAQFAMPLGGRAWRGWFPLAGELTSGRPDWKEGLYLGTELGDEDPRVASGVPLHGRNLIPGDDVLPGLRQTIFEWMKEVTALGHRVMQGIARSLDLPAEYFASRYTADPLILFRIFCYPSRPIPEGLDVRDGVGEHTDYGLLTLLRQDAVGGLEVHTTQGWIEAPPVPRSFVCNIGDMLDRMTGGLYRSTPHRVRLNTSGRDRLSFPLFFDPNFDARIAPIRSAATDDSATRWDAASVHDFEGSYGDYVLGKVGKVFPDLRRALSLGAAVSGRAGSTSDRSP
jgi:isopenicillin N synthase-like dioxygenase